MVRPGLQAFSGAILSTPESPAAAAPHSRVCSHAVLTHAARQELPELKGFGMLQKPTTLAMRVGRASRDRRTGARSDGIPEENLTTRLAQQTIALPLILVEELICGRLIWKESIRD